MTTAHRPTWAPAKGGEEQGGMRFYAPSQARSVKDIAGFTKMKYRKDGQGSKKDLKGRDARAEIEERELQHFSKLSREEFLSECDRDLKLLGNDEGRGQVGTEEPQLTTMQQNPQDADVEDASDTPGDSESDDSSESDDDEAELLAELERIRAERAEQARAREAEEAAREEEEMRQMVAGGNPLLQEQLVEKSDDKGFKMKRRWDDDVVFRNQASSEPARRKQFINDTVRSDFHKKFMSRYFN